MVVRHPSVVLTVTPVDPPGHGVTLLMGAEPPILPIENTWRVIDRPRRVGAVEYVGAPPLTMSLSVALSFADVSRSIEELLVQLVQKLALPKPPRNEPPVLRVAGPSIPPIGQYVRWVLTRLVPGEEERNDDGTRNLAFFVMEFLEYVPPTLILSSGDSKAKSAAGRARAAAPTNPTAGSAPPPSSSTYLVKAGDTLSSIASRKLGSAGRWQEIASLNGIRDPKAITPGQEIRLP